jgi:hypothetical protein
MLSPLARSSTHELRNEVVASSKPGEKYASLRKKKLVPHKGGIYEQYHQCDGEHPDHISVCPRDAILVWGGRAHRALSSQAGRARRHQLSLVRFARRRGLAL